MPFKPVHPEGMRYVDLLRDRPVRFVEWTEFIPETPRCTVPIAFPMAFVAPFVSHHAETPKPSPGRVAETSARPTAERAGGDQSSKTLLQSTARGYDRDLPIRYSSG